MLKVLWKIHQYFVSFHGKSKAQRRIEPSSQFINLGYRYFLMYSKCVSKLGILLCVEWCIISLQFLYDYFEIHKIIRLLWNRQKYTWVVDGLWSSPSTMARSKFFGIYDPRKGKSVPNSFKWQILSHGTMHFSVYIYSSKYCKHRIPFLWLNAIRIHKDATSITITFIHEIEYWHLYHIQL